MNGKGYFHYLTQALLGRIKDAPPAMPVLPNGLVVITLTSSLPGVGKTVTAAALKTLLEREGARVFVSNPSWKQSTSPWNEADVLAGVPIRDRVELLGGHYHYLIRDIDAG